MIKSFAHKGLEQFHRTGSLAGIQPIHAKKLRLILALLGAADVVTISIGMVHFLPHAGLALPQVLEQADIALYQAKANGRDGFVIQQL